MVVYICQKLFFQFIPSSSSPTVSTSPFSMIPSGLWPSARGVNGFWKLDCKSRYDQIPMTKGKEASFHLSVEVLLIWVCSQNLGNSCCFYIQRLMEKVTAEMSSLQVWDFFNVNINRRVTHTAAGLGMCRKLTVKLHWCSHMSGRGDRAPTSRRGGHGEVMTPCPQSDGPSREGC